MIYWAGADDLMSGTSWSGASGWFTGHTVLKRCRITHKQTHDSPVSKGLLLRGQFIISKYTVCTVCAHDGVTFLIISTACICSLLFSFICAGGLWSHNKLRLIKALICSHSPPLADSIYLPALPCLIPTNSIITLLEWEPIQDQYLSTNIPLIVFFRVCEFPLSKSINTQKQNWANQNKLRLPQSAQREQYETGIVCWINK